MQARCRTEDVGGTALAAYLMRQCRFHEIDPLGPENVLIFAAGPLTGANVPTSGRYAVIAKSPATGIWGETDSGGRFGIAEWLVVSPSRIAAVDPSAEDDVSRFGLEAATRFG